MILYNFYMLIGTNKITLYQKSLPVDMYLVPSN